MTTEQRAALDAAIKNAHHLPPIQRENLFRLRVREALRALPPDQHEAFIQTLELAAWQPDTVNA